MEILVSVLVILLVMLVVYFLVKYNQLMRVAINKDNALLDMARDLDAIFASIDDLAKLIKKTGIKKQLTHIAKLAAQAQDASIKIATYNQLIEFVDMHELNLPSSFTQPMQSSLPSRRFYNRETKSYNALLRIFPTNALGKLLNYEELPFLLLLDKEKEGETPEIISL